MARQQQAGPRVGARRRYSGQSLVELALLLPLITLILVGAVDLGRVFFYYARLTNAVKEGALYGTYYPTDSANIVNSAYTEAQGYLGTTGTDFVIDTGSDITCYKLLTTTTIPCSSAGTNDSIAVRGSYKFRPMTAQVVRIWGTTFTIRKTVRMVLI
ncbi:MAG TPA: TadE/TadG family type IV pilus assembly protein [Thermomicrobiales bacterium]|nr:TadE/TadG family type IV pilus assembly protein [Thermomicrobiales bacterium]